MKLEHAVELMKVLIVTIVDCTLIYDKCQSPLVEKVLKENIRRYKQVKEIIKLHKKLDKAIAEGSELWKNINKQKNFL